MSAVYVYMHKHARLRGSGDMLHQTGSCINISVLGHLVIFCSGQKIFRRKSVCRLENNTIYSHVITILETPSLQNVH